MGPGDAVAAATRRLGVPVSLLDADDLAFGDLSRFTTIVTGIRAYETRADLCSHHARLVRFMEDGGHLVVQYNRDGFNLGASTSPLPPHPAPPPPPPRRGPTGPHQRRDGARPHPRSRASALHGAQRRSRLGLGGLG